MKKIPIMLAAGTVIFMLFSCGQTENTEDMKKGIMDDTEEISQDAGKTALDGKEGIGGTALDEKKDNGENVSDGKKGIGENASDGKEGIGGTASDEKSYIGKTASDEKEDIGGTASDEKEDIGENVSDRKDTDKTTSQTEKGSAYGKSKFIDYEALGIKEYEYPAEFVMGNDLKTAITQLALSYTDFDSGTPGTGGFKEFFIAEFIQNSRLSFDYLDRISEQNNGQISIDELNYMQYSLTGMELDFSTAVSGSIDRYDAASLLIHGSITEYDYEETDSGVLVTADLEAGYDGTEDTQKYKVTVELVRDPYSCFDGYSIVSLSSTAADNMQGNAEPAL